MADDGAHSKRPSAASRGPAPPERRRTAAGRVLGAVLVDVTAPVWRRQRTPVARLVIDWEQIVGPALSRVTAPRRLSGGTLSIACSGPAALEIQHQAPQLIERINGYFGAGPRLFVDAPERYAAALPVCRVRVLNEVLSIALPNGPALATPPPTPDVVLPELPEGPLRAALERLGGAVASKKNRSV